MSRLRVDYPSNNVYLWDVLEHIPRWGSRGIVLTFTFRHIILRTNEYFPSPHKLHTTAPTLDVTWHFSFFPFCVAVFKEFSDCVYN